MNYEMFKHSTLGELLSVQATRYPRQVFLRSGAQSQTYAEVEYQASALAAGLMTLGLKAGERLGVILPNIPAYVVTIFAAARAGLILVPVNVRRDAQGILARFTTTRPKAVIAFSEPAHFKGMDHAAVVRDLRPQLPDLQHLITVSPLPSKEKEFLAWDDLLQATAPLPAPHIRPEDVAAIVHTLGSSGEPRGAMLTHGALVRNAAAIASSLACTVEDVFLATVPFSNTFGLTATILACAVSGAQLVCLPRYSAEEALRLIQEARVTVHHGVPTMFALELNHPAFRATDCSSLRTGIMSGAPCPPELVKRVRHEMGLNLIVAYGLTEASPAVTMTRLDDGPATATETVGRPIEGVEIKLITPEGDTPPAGTEGELCVRGYNVMRGYWEKPEETARVLDPEGWLHTGDLATIDADGVVRIVGRTKEVIICGGFKIHPASVEIVLRSFPGVKEAAVVGVPDLIYGERIYACVVRQPGADFQAEELLAFAAGHLPEYSLPARILFFDSLPRRGGGAVQKEYLRERVYIRGRAWVFGKNIDTDAIIPARHCNTVDPRELARHCMEDADAEFARKMHRGDVIVADANFGCGSSREVAPLAIKAAGVSAVIATSFARIFFRNAINIGLPILECPEAKDGIREGDEVEVELATGLIRNLTSGQTFRAAPFPEFLKRIIDCGGLLAYVEERLAREARETASEVSP